MACFVHTSGSSGVDLSGLTSGEQLFIGLLFNRIGGTVNNSGQMISIGSPNLTVNENPRIWPAIEVSKIYSFTMYSERFNSGYTPSGWVRFNFRNANWGGTSMVQTELTVNSNVEGILDGNESDRKYTEILYSLQNMYATVTSFTTTDGKVHTAANLNY